MWLYGSGFPKSQNISKILDKKFGKERPIIGYTDNAGIAKNEKPDSTGSHIWSGNITSDEPITDLAKQWNGWGTALKPSFEPIIIARKPFKGSLVDNVIEYGVGGINIDECRVGNGTGNAKPKYEPNNKNNVYGKGLGCGNYENTNGRFPANTILTYDETDFDEVCGGFPNTNGGKRHNTTKRIEEGTSYYKDKEFVFNRNEFNDSGSASRYFYCAKASKKDRDEGLDEFEEVDTTELLNRKANTAGVLWEQGGTNVFSGAGGIKKNTHPTVKPTSLMQYLVRLVTPKGGTILDPFMGSGSTGKAVMFENKERKADYNFIGIEKEKDYCNIAEARIRWAEEYKEKKENGNQISFEDLEAKDEI